MNFFLFIINESYGTSPRLRDQPRTKTEERGREMGFYFREEQSKREIEKGQFKSKEAGPHKPLTRDKENTKSACMRV